MMNNIKGRHHRPNVRNADKHQLIDTAKFMGRSLTRIAAIRQATPLIL
ncbi:MAG: hypothetical protein JW841_12060 [Deltaproteobacteria bacterium]|nr:hypothetical protein [Deltaproteobacteria bacterium]